MFLVSLSAVSTDVLASTVVEMTTMWSYRLAAHPNLHIVRPASKVVTLRVPYDDRKSMWLAER